MPSVPGSQFLDASMDTLLLEGQVSEAALSSLLFLLAFLPAWHLADCTDVLLLMHIAEKISITSLLPLTLDSA